MVSLSLKQVGEEDKQVAGDLQHSQDVLKMVIKQQEGYKNNCTDKLDTEVH